jgi:hypothetical protein
MGTFDGFTMLQLFIFGVYACIVYRGRLQYGLENRQLFGSGELQWGREKIVKFWDCGLIQLTIERDNGCQ